MGIVRGMSNALEKTCIEPWLGPVEVPPARPAGPKISPVPDLSPLQAPPEPLWNVILIDDNVHTFEYVVEMLGSIFGHPPNRADKLARMVHESGRVIVATVHKELAELRQEQIQTFGPDPRVSECADSMQAEIEPAA
jgi:ATP-dependent Clp protease adaptor protein ClpS